VPQPISAENVRRALTDLSRDRAPRTSPLIELCAVGREIRRQGMSDSTAARMYVLCRILTRLAEDEIARLRATAAVPAVPYGQPAVVADFAVDHPELEAWSAVYHVYMRPDLNFGLRRLTHVLGDRHRRTVQRRLRRGVLGLTRALFEAESAALTAERADITAAAIPRLPEGAVRDMPTARAAAASLLESPHGVLVVTGCPGSGKTTLAALIARELSRTAGLAVAWVDEPDRARLGELGFEGIDVRSSRPRQAPPSADTVVVLDGLDDLATVRHVESLVHPPCRVIVTTMCAPVANLASKRIDCAPLRHEVVRERLLEGMLALGGTRDELAPEHLDALADGIEGSQLALAAALQQLRVTSWTSVLAALRTPSGFGLALAERMWRRRWNQAPAGARDLVLAASDAGRWRRLDPERVADREDLATVAVESGLVRSEGSVFARAYVLAPLLAQFLRQDRGRIASAARSYAELESRAATAPGRLERPVRVSAS
jgi:hypothetical protein